MGKIAIITLYGLYNYGNRFQNYALQVLMSRLGYHAETLVILDRNNIFKYFKEYIKKHVGSFFSGFPVQSIRIKAIRKNSFYMFDKEIEKRIVSKSKIRNSKLLNSYYKILFGSDQIWNTEFDTFDKLYLGFYSEKNKNIAVSASFGTNDIAPEYQNLFKEGLQNFSSISVREKRAKEIIEKYTDCECVVMPDPTLCISREEWMKVERKVEVPEKYAFTYFLGEVPDIDFKGLPVIHGGYKSEYGPSEFIFLIRNADVVYTDSFHACVFCIIFGTPFYVYNRKSQYSSMISRMDTLFTHFSLNYTETLDYLYVSKEQLSNPDINKKIIDLSNQLISFLKENL